MEILLDKEEVLFLKILCTVESNNLNNYLLINRHKSSDDPDIKVCKSDIELIKSILDKLYI